MDTTIEAALPFVDEHALTIDASRGAVWAALERFVDGMIGGAGNDLLARVLGAEPRGGFAIAERVPLRELVLEGRHRFARYRLSFALADAQGGGTVLRALTHAEFPGARGKVYRALVIGTRLHVAATRGMLHAVKRRCLAS
ncbi:MAG TPA: hypothetical protein VG755_26010 [Nannocystaceae bacterium]|nr:hypothetical protein [Nannocystaceae bacterium]